MVGRSLALCLGLVALATGPSASWRGVAATWAWAAPSGSAAITAVRPAYGYTHLRSDGNRWLEGRGTLPRTAPLDVALGGVPRWVVAAPHPDGLIWAVALDDGRIQAFMTGPGRHTARPVHVRPDRLPPNMPPLLRIHGRAAALVTAPDPQASPLTHPVPLGASGLAYVTTRGEIVVTRAGARRSVGPRALPDVRLLTDEMNVLVLTDPTPRYAHGVLGDTLEAASLTLVRAGSAVPIPVTWELPAERVIESVVPLWADLDGKDQREIIVPVSDARQGTRIQVLDVAGQLIASGPGFDRSHRWRHPLAVAPFGADGAQELAVVRTPHLGGVVEFYRLVDRRLRVTAEVSGYTSHVLGSRNLDMAAAADFDGDGRVELLLPSQSLDVLGAIRRTRSGAEVAWTMALGGRLSANLSVVRHPDGRLAVGAGREDRVLRLWLP